MSDEFQERLARLQELFDGKLITSEEFEDRRRRLLDDYLGAPGGSPEEPAPAKDPFATSEGDSYSPRRATRLADLMSGLEIGPDDNRFRLVRKIGGGAMGQVWLAHDLEEEKLEGGERFKALKVVNPALQDAPRALEMLKREAVRAAKLSHQHIINIYGWRQGQDGWLFVVMDFLEGRDLDRLLLEEGKPGLSWERTLQLLKPIAAGIDYAHARQVIHCDLKPGNVFITDEDEVKILDFGLAYRLHRSGTLVKVEETGSSGTPEYMPPEAFSAGEPERSRDIYALACLVYEMLTGESPYNAYAAVHRNPDLFPGKPEVLSEAAWEVLESGLAYRKEDRPDSAEELVRRLEAAQAAPEPIPVKEPETSTSPPEQTVIGEPETHKSEEKHSPQPVAEPKPEAISTPISQWRVGKSHMLMGLLAFLMIGGAGIYFWPPSPSIEDIQGWPSDKVKALQEQTAEALGMPVLLRDGLKDGGEGPEMVVIPAGKFLMGSPGDEPGRYDNERQHPVTIEKPFAIGKYEVTFEQYDRFAEATGRDKPDDEGWGRGRRPVINVDWHDAVAYAEWLSGQTAQEYRLPTEVEWEYAARAGTATPFHFGKTISTDQANYDGNYTYAGGSKGVYRNKTVEVGQFPANAWGLHDVHGNVWEWTCSEYDEDYGGAELECVSKNNASARRVLRGGSWNSYRASCVRRTAAGTGRTTGATSWVFAWPGP